MIPNHPDGRPLASSLPIVVLAGLAALAFRAGAILSPSKYIVIPSSLALALGLLGVLFLACGVWVWRVRRTPLTRVFLVYAIGGCLHWGGSIAGGGAGMEISFLVFYVAGTLMADAAFLDMALRYPRPTRRGRFPTIGFYVPAMVVALAVPFASLIPTAVLESALGLAIGVAFFVSILAGIILLVKWFRASRVERSEQGLNLIALSLVVSTVLDLLGENGTLPGDPALWTLSYAIVPVAFARAMLRLPEAPEGAPSD